MRAPIDRLPWNRVVYRPITVNTNSITRNIVIVGPSAPMRACKYMTNEMITNIQVNYHRSLHERMHCPNDKALDPSVTRKTSKCLKNQLLIRKV